MIKIENDKMMIPNKTNIYLTRKYGTTNKAPFIYIRLLADQQNGIYYEDINEIGKQFNLCKKTTIKYINILKNEGLIYKLNGVYIINYTPQKQIKKDEISRYNAKDRYLYNKYMKAD